MFYFTPPSQHTRINCYARFITLIAGFAFLSCASSCKKEAHLSTAASNNTKTMKAITGTLTLSTRPLDMSEPELYLYSEDVSLERIDMARYALGKAFKEVITPEILESLKTEASQRANNSLLFSTIFELYPDLAAQLDEALTNQALPECPYDFTSYQKIKDEMFDDNDNYEPNLYFYNLASNPTTSSFILSPSLEIEDEDGFDDQIMAWYKEGQSDYTEIKLNEEEARVSKDLIATIGLQGNIVWPGTPGGGTTPIPAVPTPYDYIYMPKINIHQRYEKHGKSEVYAYGYNTTNSLKCFSTFPGDFSRHLCSTKKTWEWVDCDENSLLFSTTPSIIWNTFERDWYQPWQPIATLESSLNINENAWVPMTRADEWYALTPGTNNSSNNKSLRNSSNSLKNTIHANGTNLTYFVGDGNKFECYFNAGN